MARPVLSCPVLSCPVLSCPVLSFRVPSIHVTEHLPSSNVTLTPVGLSFGDPLSDGDILKVV